jgi:foldase protein PrsA
MPKKKSTSKKTTPKKNKIQDIKKKIDPKKIIPKKIDLKKVKLPKVKGTESLKPALKVVGIVLLIVTSLALIDLGVQYLNNDYSVAVVNGNRISKNLWHDRLAAAYGPSVASQLIDEEIITMEAKKADVSVTEEAIDKEIDLIIESIGGEESFESALAANNLSLEELRDQIRMDLLATELLAPDLEYTEEDVKEFFDQYSDVIFPEETAELEEGELLAFEDYKERTEEVYVQQEVQNYKATWLAEKRAEYKIQDNSTGKPEYGFLTITTNIINNLLDQVSGEGTVEEAETEAETE